MGIFDMGPSIAGTILFVAAAGMLGFASKNFFDRAKEENKGLSAGTGMDQHLSALKTSADCALETSAVNTDSYIADDEAKEEAIAETEKETTKQLAEQKVPPEDTNNANGENGNNSFGSNPFSGISSQGGGGSQSSGSQGGGSQGGSSAY